MPELPEVETVVKALRGVLVGRVVESARFLGRLRLPFDEFAVSNLLSGKVIGDVRRRAKYILVDFPDADGAALLAHLGMTGYFHIEPAATPCHRHDRVVFSLRGGEELRFADARRFGFVKAVRIASPHGFPKELAGLGPEPLSRNFSGRFLEERATGRSCPVKTFIMDQAVVVGVGNIYANEALFEAGIDPKRPVSGLSTEEWLRVADRIKAILRRAIRKGGSTIKNYRTVDGSEGGFQRALRIYGKKDGVCPVCGDKVLTIRQCGRSTFYCPNCQK